MELLLNHKLSKPTKDLIALRIRDVELGFFHKPLIASDKVAPPYRLQPGVAQQSPSTMAILAKNPDLMAAQRDLPAAVPIEQAVPVEQIAQTPATAAALQARSDAIRQATGAGPFTGKPERGRTSPRKF